MNKNPPIMVFIHFSGRKARVSQELKSQYYNNLFALKCVKKCLDNNSIIKSFYRNVSSKTLEIIIKKTGLVKGLEFLKKYGNLQTSFPDLEKKYQK